LKTILQSPYTTEIANEELLKTVDNTVKPTVIDCSTDISEQVIELLCKNSHSAQQEEYNNAQQQDQRQTQCAQQ
jgi:hypothetical protein